MSMVLDRVLHDDVEPEQDFKTVYLQTMRHLERLHRLLLDVIRDEFERGEKLGVTAVQALLLYNIGDQELTPGELRGRGYYLGSNVSYNLKKLMSSGYIEKKVSSLDRRSVSIRLTTVGKDICDRIDELYDRQLQAVEAIGGLAIDEMSNMNDNMQRLERFWHDQIRFKL